MVGPELDALWRDEDNWRLFYSVYVCKDDPRVVVPKISPAGRPVRWLGTTWNFAHLRVYPTILTVIAMFLGPPAIALSLGAPPWLVGVLAVASLAVVYEVAWRMATRAPGRPPGA